MAFWRIFSALVGIWFLGFWNLDLISLVHQHFTQ
jgi:hypothetical protein